MTMGPVTSSADESPVSVEEATATPPGVEPKQIEGRSLSRIAWTRLKKDRVALAGGIVIIFLIVVAILAGPINKLLGHPQNEFHPEKVDPNLGGIPTPGTWGGISKDFILGVEPPFGRDLFTQVIYGARVSLLVALAATLVAVIIGVVLGVVAGYFGGWIDAVISRLMDLVLSFPYLLLRDRADLGAAAQSRAGGSSVVDRHHRVLQLALHRPHRARPDALAARA